VVDENNVISINPINTNNYNNNNNNSRPNLYENKFKALNSSSLSLSGNNIENNNELGPAS